MASIKDLYHPCASNDSKKMLDQEARELLVKTYDEIRDAKKVAAIYGVSSWTVYFYVKEAREGKSLEVRTSGRGRKPKLTEQDKKAIEDCILEKPDITIHEINEKLNLPVTDEQVRHTVNEMEFHRKKKSMHAVERERPRCSGETKRVEDSDKDT